MSTRHETVCSVKHIAERGVAYGMRSETLDGQDVLVVWDAVRRAAARARSGEGPELVEALTYRYGDHSYLMNRLRYRTDEEVDFWRANDPISNLARDLVASGIASDAELELVAREVDGEVQAAIAFSREAALPTKDRLWERMYVDPSGFPERRHHRAWYGPAGSQS